MRPFEADVRKQNQGAGYEQVGCCGAQKKPAGIVCLCDIYKTCVVLRENKNCETLQTKKACGVNGRFFSLLICSTTCFMNTKTDFWPFLRATATGANASGTMGTSGELHFVRAGKNTAWADTPGVLAGFDELGAMETEAEADAGGAAGRVQLHTLPEVGHWVHIEAAGRVFGMLNEAFERADAAADASPF